MIAELEDLMMTKTDQLKESFVKVWQEIRSKIVFAGREDGTRLSKQTGEYFNA